jgi:transposase
VSPSDPGQAVQKGGRIRASPTEVPLTWTAVKTFYILRARLARRGIAGLCEARPGRVGPVKCTPEVVEFLETQRATDPALSIPELVNRLARERGVRLHRRTVERLVGRRERKKLFLAMTRPRAFRGRSMPRPSSRRRILFSGSTRRTGRPT